MPNIHARPRALLYAATRRNPNPIPSLSPTRTAHRPPPYSPPSRLCPRPPPCSPPSRPCSTTRSTLLLYSPRLYLANYGRAWQRRLRRRPGCLQPEPQQWIWGRRRDARLLGLLRSKPLRLRRWFKLLPEPAPRVRWPGHQRWQGMGARRRGRLRRASPRQQGPHAASRPSSVGRRFAASVVPPASASAINSAFTRRRLWRPAVA